MRLSTFIKPFTHLKLKSFRELSNERFGALDDNETDWAYFQFVVQKFFEGLYLAVDTNSQGKLLQELEKEKIEYRGFVYEGAGMGLIMLDSFLPFKNRFDSFMRLAGAQYELLVQIGAGMGFGYLATGMPVRLVRRDTNKFVDRQDPMHRWLVVDGYGFFDGMVNWKRVITQRKQPGDLAGYGLRAYDQGVGRSLWICTGGHPGRFKQSIETFPRGRQADLWGGIGEGLAYAGGVADFTRVRDLAREAGDFAEHFAAGVVVGAVGRVRAGERSVHTDLACTAIWECDSETLVASADARWDDGLGSVADDDLYEHWRAGLRREWAAEHQHLADMHSS
ncbi:MAG: DUF1702 family protein [Rhodococcus sp. (in: high G+C Gram-positive bacteria)]